jgi:hypothetical protein
MALPQLAYTATEAMMFGSKMRVSALVAIVWTLAACSTASLSSGGAQVAATRNPAPEGCKPLGYVVGKGGGTFGGGFVSNEDLIEYAMNDIRNKAAEAGANYLQHDPPTLGQGDGTTTTATITGTAYACPTEGSTN